MSCEETSGINTLPSQQVREASLELQTLNQGFAQGVEYATPRLCEPLHILDSFFLFSDRGRKGRGLLRFKFQLGSLRHLEAQNHQIFHTAWPERPLLKEPYSEDRILLLQYFCNKANKAFRSAALLGRWPFGPERKGFFFTALIFRLE